MLSLASNICSTHTHQEAMTDEAAKHKLLRWCNNCDQCGRQQKWENGGLGREGGREGGNKTYKIRDDTSVGDIRHRKPEDDSQRQSATVEAESLLQILPCGSPILHVPVLVHFHASRHRQQLLPWRRWCSDQTLTLILLSRASFLRLRSLSLSLSLSFVRDCAEILFHILITFGTSA